MLTSETPKQGYRASQFLWFGVWSAVTSVAAVLRPDHVGHGTHQQLGLPPCPSVVFFGRPCPACGLTTSWTATVHGDLATAFQAHALGTILYLLFTISALVSLYGAIKGIRYSTDTPQFNRAAIIVAAIFFSYGVLRFFLSSPAYRTPYERAWSQAVSPLPGK